MCTCKQILIFGKKPLWIYTLLTGRPTSSCHSAQIHLSIKQLIDTDTWSAFGLNRSIFISSLFRLICKGALSWLLSNMLLTLPFPPDSTWWYRSHFSATHSRFFPLTQAFWAITLSYLYSYCFLFFPHHLANLIYLQHWTQRLPPLPTLPDLNTHCPTDNIVS